VSPRLPAISVEEDANKEEDLVELATPNLTYSTAQPEKKVVDEQNKEENNSSDENERNMHYVEDLDDNNDKDQNERYDNANQNESQSNETQKHDEILINKNNKHRRGRSLGAIQSLKIVTNWRDPNFQVHERRNPSLELLGAEKQRKKK